MSQEKTEQPTSHKLRKALEEGDAPQSKDFVTTSVTVLGFSILLGFGGLFGAYLMVYTQRILRAGFAPDFQTALAAAASESGEVFITLLAPFTLSALVAAPLATVLGQGGLHMAKYKLKFEALDPVKNLGQRFSTQNLIEFVKALLRFTVIVAIFVFVIREGAPILLLTPFCGLDCASAVARDMALLFVAIVFAVMFLMAFLDLLIQRAIWIKKQKMTPEEIKREHKELDGDPMMKGARKSMARRLTAVTLEEAVAYAGVLFEDGDGRAVAVYHSFSREDPNVAVTLGGAGELAQSLLTRARAEGVTVIRDAEMVAACIGLSGMQPVEDPALKATITARMLKAGLQF